MGVDASTKREGNVNSHVSPAPPLCFHFLAEREDHGHSPNDPRIHAPRQSHLLCRLSQWCVCVQEHDTGSAEYVPAPLALRWLALPCSPLIDSAGVPTHWPGAVGRAKQQDRLSRPLVRTSAPPLDAAVMQSRLFMLHTPAVLCTSLLDEFVACASVPQVPISSLRFVSMSAVVERTAETGPRVLPTALDVVVLLPLEAFAAPMTILPKAMRCQSCVTHCHVLVTPTHVLAKPCSPR
uniref:Uncharacterized protein n=1 Tax=Lygus hesperus TaxID=30085 RepID=A0A146MC39_LYGHE